MEVRICPAFLKGTVSVPVSKSLMHRHLICQTLAGGAVAVPPGSGDDIDHTAKALLTLQGQGTEIDCGMSGSTLRFLLPIAMALGKIGTTFSGDARLLERPLYVNLPMERTPRGWKIIDRLTPGQYALPANETSQMISGLLMALPLLDKPSKIMLTTKAVSQPYLDMTVAVMAQHGVLVEKCDNGYRIPAPQTYRKAELFAEGDWSAAAWYVGINALKKGDVFVENMETSSLQGDSRIINYVNSNLGEIDISQTPDLLPPLSLWAALQDGKTTRFTHGAFLRRKESDRLHQTAVILNTLGAQVMEEPDGLTIHGVKELTGGKKVDACADHRMAMLAAFAGALCKQEIVLSGAESVSKSYPNFWRDYVHLGGRLEVTEP